MLSLTYTISFLIIVLDLLIVISIPLMCARLSIGLLPIQVQSRCRTKQAYAHSCGSKQRLESIVPVRSTITCID
jgi:hypothetical protein